MWQCFLLSREGEARQALRWPVAVRPGRRNGAIPQVPWPSGRTAQRLSRFLRVWFMQPAAAEQKPQGPA